MSEDKKNQDKTKRSAKEATSSRRAFLKFGALSGAAGLLGAIPALAGDSDDAKAPPESEETVAMLNQDGQLVAVKKSQVGYPTGEVVTEREKVRQGVPGKKFVMVIDLASCRNARKCVDACSATHGLWPHQEYLNVKKMRNNDKAGEFWMPQLCFHCDNPPCTKVCPVGATFKRDDGVVAIDNKQCIGCRFCMAACPYNARIFNWTEPKETERAAHHGYSPETSLPKKQGTVDKCDFCVDMARDGKLPHCVTACPNGVFYYGDENEDVVSNGSETVRLSTLLEEKGGYRYMEELGTKPRTYYLPPRNREFPFEEGLENYEKAKEKMENYRLDLNPNQEGQSHE